MKRTLPCLLLLALFSLNYNSLKGQQPTIDQLMEKAHALQFPNTDSSIIVYKQILELAAKEKNNDILANVNGILSDISYHKSLYQDAINYATIGLQHSDNATDSAYILIKQGKAIAITNINLADSLFSEAERIADKIKDSTVYSALYGNYTNIKTSKGDLDAGLDYMVKGLAYMQHDLPKATMCSNIANTFLLMGNIERAEEYILRAIEICDRNNYKVRNAQPAAVYASVLMAKGDYKTARHELETSIEYLTEKKQASLIAFANNTLARLDIKEGKWKNALEHNILAKKELNIVPPKYATEILLTSATINYHNGQYNDAFKDADAALLVANNAQLRNPKLEALELASNALEKINKPNEALSYFKQFDSLKDSIYNQDQLLLTSRLEAEFKRDEQENSINYLDAKTELQALKLSRKNSVILFGALAILAFGLLSFFLLRLYKQVSKQKALLAKAVEEKDVLLREIHHRVKNNLQLVSSLLGLQSHHVADKEALEVLNTGKARVKSMALIHQDLYNRENLTGVNVKQYLEKLCSELFSTYNIDKEQVTLTTNIEDISLDVDTLVPLGLIINELITNSLKYAFPENRKGNINISLKEENNSLKLVVVDNGVGYNQSDVNDQSFGYKLINTLLEQLDGNIVQDASNGTSVSIEIDDYKIAA